MRAGLLDRTISIEAATYSEPNATGGVTTTWGSFATVRAQLVQSSTEEFLRASGEQSETALVFRIRYLSDLTNSHRLTFEGRKFDIREVKEIGRRQTLEIRCVERGS